MVKKEMRSEEEKANILRKVRTFLIITFGVFTCGALTVSIFF